LFTLVFQRAEEDTSSLYSWVSESDWSSDYEEFVEKKDRTDPQTEEKPRETTPRPTIPSKYSFTVKKAVLRILIGFNTDPDPAFFVKADPDPDPGI
jgi:hypothetical protein